jgi:hypothetical protein
MTEVFTHPKELEKFLPKTTVFESVQKVLQEEEAFIEQVQKYCKKNGSGKYAGELFQIPMGDGYAQYVVHSLSPLQVIHLKIGDAWDSPDVRYYTAAHIKQKVDSLKAMNKLFS